MKKRILCLLLAAMMVMALFTGCGDKTQEPAPVEETPAEEAAPVEETPAEEPAAEPVELQIFAAASLQESLNTLAAAYMEANPNVNIVITYDSSGTLRKQIEEGAEVDIFISASPKHMNLIDAACDEEKNPDKQDFVISETRFNILENKVALAVPEGNPKGIDSFEKLAELLKAGDVMFAMGNEDVPVGKYTSKILAYLGLDEAEVVSCITYGSNVKEVTSQIAEAAVDCGCIYTTDAFSAGLDYVEVATEEMCGRVIYPAALLKTTKNQEAAQAFLDFLDSAEGDAGFEAVGFTPYVD